MERGGIVSVAGRRQACGDGARSREAGGAGWTLRGGGGGEDGGAACSEQCPWWAGSVGGCRTRLEKAVDLMSVAAPRGGYQRRERNVAQPAARGSAEPRGPSQRHCGLVRRGARWVPVETCCSSNMWTEEATSAGGSRRRAPAPVHDVRALALKRPDVRAGRVHRLRPACLVDAEQQICAAGRRSGAASAAVCPSLLPNGIRL